MNEDTSTLAGRIKAALAAIEGATQADLARATERAPASVSDWLSGETKTLKGESLLKASRFLRVRPEWLSSGKGPRHEAAPSGPAPTEEDGVVLESVGKPRFVRPAPVRGTAKLGTDGYYECLEGPEGYVPCFSNDPDIYALKVKGDSMYPSIRHGWFVVISPAGRCTPGRFVAVALKNGSKMVKELVFDRPHEVVVESVNGNCRLTIEREEIEQMHHVMAVISPDDWRPA